MADDRLLDDEAWSHAEMIVAGGWQARDPYYVAAREALRLDRAARTERIAALEGDLLAAMERERRVAELSVLHAVGCPATNVLSDDPCECYAGDIVRPIIAALAAFDGEG